MRYEFLNALEQSGSVGPGTGWFPAHILLQENDTLLGAVPTYVKSHSYGEYVFDHGWAQAYEKACGRYYPKLQCAIPFTPVAGRRLLLVNPDSAQAPAQIAQLLSGLSSFQRQISASSLHITFAEKSEAEQLTQLGLLQRIGQQFHFHNRGFRDFDDFLDSLTARKRKMIRRERRDAYAAGIEIESFSGSSLRSEHWDAFFAFYQDTGARKWGRPYLNRAFFDLIHASMPEDILLIMARRNGRWIAGALNFIGADALYGRYWGAIEEHPFLHFELCYYQAMEYALAKKMRRVEAGAQGEHKILRGYEPTPTFSLHDFTNPGFKAAVANFLRQETPLVNGEIEAYSQLTPFRKSDEAEI